MLVTLLPSVIAICSAVGFNAYVDPYWIFPSFGERASLRYCVDDERLNKINKMIFGGATGADVLMGSSRSSFFDTRYFSNKVFNLSVNGLRPVEYPEYLRMFIQYAGRPKDVYVGFDFFGYILEENDGVWVDRAKEKETASLSFTYRLNLLLDVGALQKSISTIRECSAAESLVSPKHRYDGGHIVAHSPRDIKHFNEQLDYFRNFYDIKKPIDANFVKNIERLKSIAPNSRFHIFIPPLTEDLLKVLVASGRANQYGQWLGILIEEFGSVTQFSGFTSFAADLSHFYDTNHVFPEETLAMIQILEGKRHASADGFGVELTKDNIGTFVLAPHGP